MTIIYNNIAAVAAVPSVLDLTGCENQVLFRANNWGTTVVQIESYSASDPTQKSAPNFAAGGGNVDWCIPCSSLGQAFRYIVSTPDPLTTELFVEILEPGCCCTPTVNECFELPVRLVPCE